MARKCVRYTSSMKILGWPLLAIACGPDPATGETRGWAKGIVAFGDIATGVIAIGGLAGGGVAVGGLACGLATVGGVALGGLVLAGVAIGGVSFGGVAVGHYAKGGVGVGTYVVSPKRQDPEALRIFGGKTREEKVDRPPMEEEAKR